jgi:hypothetical protein
MTNAPWIASWNDGRTPSVSGASPGATPLAWNPTTAATAMTSPGAAGAPAPSGSAEPIAPLSAARAPLSTGRVPLDAVAAAAARDAAAPAPRAAIAYAAVTGPSRPDQGWDVRWQPSATAAAAAPAATASPMRAAPTLSRGAGSRSQPLTATWYTIRVAGARRR